jgi:hypothetical protein
MPLISSPIPREASQSSRTDSPSARSTMLPTTTRSLGCAPTSGLRCVPTCSRRTMDRRFDTHSKRCTVPVSSCRDSGRLDTGTDLLNIRYRRFREAG